MGGSCKTSPRLKTKVICPIPTPTPIANNKLTLIPNPVLTPLVKKSINVTKKTLLPLDSGSGSVSRQKFNFSCLKKYSGSNFDSNRPRIESTPTLTPTQESELPIFDLITNKASNFEDTFYI